MRLARLRSSRIREKNSAEDEESIHQERAQALETGESVKPPEDPEPGGNTTGSDLIDDAISTRSREILSLGDPLSFMLETFGQSHEGDQTVAECLIHSLASRSVINSKGLHVSITGESGKGKSHAIDTMRTLIPEEFRLEGRVSDKALFYMEDLKPGTVITLDDVTLSDQMQEILKGVTTSFQKPFPYRTVNKDRKPQICVIPERCVWWIAKVEGAGDDQIFNRMLTCWIDDSEEQDLKVLSRTLAGAEQMPGSLVQVSDEVQVCRQIWGDLDPVWVVIPYATRIRFQSAENRRNPDMLLDLIRTNAALCQKQREATVIDGTACVVATREDFDQAARLFVALNGDTGGQGNKLTRREAALIDAIASLGLSEVTIPQLQRNTGWANSTIGKLLHGYRSYGKSYSGLLEKCPAVSYLDRTVTTGDEGCTTLRRMKVYLWDPVLYEAWVKGGSVWLAEEPGTEDFESGDPDTGPDDSSGEVTFPPEDESQDQEESRTDTECMDAGDRTDCSTLSSGDGENTSPRSVGDEQTCFTREHQEDGTGQRPGVSLSSIIPHEFIAIDGFPDRRRCSVCGKKPTLFQERMTVKRMRERPHPNMMLCSSCYHRAVSREAAGIIPLPGMIDTSRMVQRSSSVGRCQICDLMPAVWSDPGSRTHLCSSCYLRESDRRGSGSFSGSGPPERGSQGNTGRLD